MSPIPQRLAFFTHPVAEGEVEVLAVVETSGHVNTDTGAIEYRAKTLAGETIVTGHALITTCTRVDRTTAIALAPMLA